MFSLTLAEVVMRSTYSHYRLALLIIVAAAISGCMAMMAPPANLDYSRIRTSDSGRYRAAIKPDGDSIPQGKLQSGRSTSRRRPAPRRRCDGQRRRRNAAARPRSADEAAASPATSATATTSWKG